LAHVIFLWHFRSILIVTVPLPLAVLGSFLFMYGAGISSNIMSLGGIAIAIGVLVDAGIVMTENVIRQAEKVVGEVCPTCASTVERVMEVVRGGASLPARKRGQKLIRTGEQQVQGENRGLVLDFLASRRAGA